MEVAAGQAAFQAMRLAATRLTPERLAGMGGWLILAPHPDDETLGAAGLIAVLAARGVPAWVAFLTDGSASHPHAPGWPPERIARTRAQEARQALRVLGAPARRMVQLGWRDGAPHAAGTREFERTCDRLLRLCRRAGIRAVATCWRGEGHCDHQAAYALAASLNRRSGGRIALFEYLVWGWTDCDVVAKTRESRRFTLDWSHLAGLGRRAIHHHRSQVSPLIRGAEPGFRLSPDMIALAGRSPAILLRGGHPDAP